MAISDGSDGGGNDGLGGGRGRRGSVGPSLSGGGSRRAGQDCAVLLRHAVAADDEQEVKRLLAGEGGQEAGWFVDGVQGALAMAAAWGAPKCAKELAAALPKNEEGRMALHGAIVRAVGGGHAETFEALASVVGSKGREGEGLAAAARAKTGEMFALVMGWIGHGLVASELSELLWLCAGEARVEGLRMTLALPGADPWALSASGEMAVEAVARRKGWDEASRDCAEMLAEAMARSAGPARMAAMAARMEGVMQGLAGAGTRDGEGPLCFRRISERWVDVGEVGDASWPRTEAKEGRAKAL